MQTPSPSRSVHWLLWPLVLIALLGACEVLYATGKWGIGVSPDSYQYLKLAQGIAGGHGMSTLSNRGSWEPVTHWPPLYPALLALPERLGHNSLHAARWISALIFAAIVLLCGAIVWRQTRNRWASFIAAGLAALGPPMLQIHVNAWSEPLFILLTLGALALLAEYLDRPRLWLLAGGGLLAAGAMLTRYAGIALPPALCLGVLLFSRRSFGRRLLDCVPLGAIALLPYAIWAHVHGSSDREWAVHLFSGRQAVEAAAALRYWLIPKKAFPTGISIAAALLILGLLAASPAILMGRAKTESPARGAMLIWLFAVIYPVMVLVSVSFFDADIQMDQRLFSPLFVAAILVAACAASRRAAWPKAFIALTILGLLLLPSYAVFAKQQISGWHRNGAGGFTRKTWQTSETMNALKALHIADDAAIYSNRRDAIEFCTGLIAYGLPGKANQATERKNAAYQEQLQNLSKRRQNERIIFVMFNSDKVESKNQPTKEELQNALPRLGVVADCHDGTIYELPESSDRRR